MGGREGEGGETEGGNLSEREKLGRERVRKLHVQERDEGKERKRTS